MTAPSAPAPVKGSTPVLIGLIIAVSMTTIDQTIVALSAPTIAQDLGISHDAIQWAVNAYLIATAAFFLLGGRLADVFGHRRLALIGIAGFGATSLLCSLAPSGDMAASWLVGARILQGIAGALMFPAAIGIVVGSFSREGRAKAMATFFAITGAMTAIGPIAGGYLSQWTWRSIFWVNIPLALVSFAIVAITARRSARLPERIDLPGAATIAAGLGLIVFGLQQAGSWGWGSPAVLASLSVGVLLVGVFVLIERRVPQPLVTLQVFAERGFTVSVVSLLFASFAFLSTFYFLSVYGQLSLQLSAGETGLLFLKFFIGFVVAAQIGARRFDRRGARSVLLIGGLIGAVGFGWLAYAARTIPVDVHSFINPQTWPIVLAGAGVGFMLSAASTDAVNRAIGASYGEVTAISQTMRNFGGALGMAVLSTVVTHQLVDSITDSFAKLGAPASAAQTAVDAINGTTDRADALSSNAPQSLQDALMHAVQQSYADAVSWAFAGAAAAMVVVAIVSLAYPKGQVSATFRDADESPAPASV